MARIATITGDATPYDFFGTFAGLPFWPGSLTLLAAEPGAGKTSWLLRMVYEAGKAGFPAALGCYEHTEQELKYRLRRQAAAAIAGPHADVFARNVERHLAQAGDAVLMELTDRDDTVRGIEERLLMEFSFPKYGPALVAVDYIQRIPVIGVGGLLPEDIRAGEAAAQLRALARKHGWAIIAATALRSSAFNQDGLSLDSLLGDERLPYEADRVLFMERDRLGKQRDCGCFPITVRTSKDRTDSLREWYMEFWGQRFYPALADEITRYTRAHRTERR